MQIGVDDIGFRQGVVAVERLRTYGGAAFLIERHLDRWCHSTIELGIDSLPSTERLRDLLEELLVKNQLLVNEFGEVGITMFATPGVTVGSPTLGLHLNKIDEDLSASRRQKGQAIVVVNVHQPDSDCWPRSIKVRSRIHYYRADCLAQESQQGAAGVLIDDDATVTETSHSNLAIVEKGRIISPPKDRVLGGITQSKVEELAMDCWITWTYEGISPQRLAAADEVLLMGTGTGIWFASEVHGQDSGKSNSPRIPGPIFLELRDRFDLSCRSHRESH